MTTRRNFLRSLPIAAASAPLLSACESTDAAPAAAPTKAIRPVVISTWQHGQMANAKAWEVLSAGGSALDAAEQGVMVTEADPEVHTVGIGSYPDRDGIVTLDACIIDRKSVV